MNDITLNLDTRAVVGKRVAALRREGLVPSVIYGADFAPVATQSVSSVTTKVVKQAGKHTPVEVRIGGKPQLALIKSIARHPVNHRVLHVAFQAVKRDEVITTEVPVRLLGMGESVAEKAGLVVLQALELIEVRATPASLPEAIEVSVTELAEADDKLTLADVTLPEGVEYADVDQDVDLVVASVYEPSALQAANEAAGGDAELTTDIDAEKGGDTPQDTQAEETRPGGKLQDEPKQSNVDARK